MVAFSSSLGILGFEEMRRPYEMKISHGALSGLKRFLEP
jgi:hypothetical protein